MKGLGSAQGSGKPLDAGPRYVIEGVLLCQTPSGSLTMGSQGHRLWIFRLERLNDPGPQEERRSHLGNLHKKIHTDSPKKRYSWSKVINGNSRFQSGPDIFQPVGKGVCQFKVCRCTGFVHVIAADADAVELRHAMGAILKYIGNQAHGRGRWIDVRIANHKFLKNVILDRATKVLRFYTLLLRRNDVKGHD